MFKQADVPDMANVRYLQLLLVNLLEQKLSIRFSTVYKLIINNNTQNKKKVESYLYKNHLAI